MIERAVALAVDTFAKEKALDIQQRREEQLSFVIHDLRTPLSAIHAAGRILETSLSEETKTGRVGNMLEIVRRNALRLNALVTTASQEQYNLAASTAQELKAKFDALIDFPFGQFVAAVLLADRIDKPLDDIIAKLVAGMSIGQITKEADMNMGEVRSGFGQFRSELARSQTNPPTKDCFKSTP